MKKKKDPVVSPDQIQTMKMLHIYASYFYSSWFISYKTTKKKGGSFQKSHLKYLQGYNSDYEFWSGRH